MNSGVQIKEGYKDYVPPINVIKIIQLLLKYVPSEYLQGLKTIVLTNSSGLPYKRRRESTWSRKKKIKIDETLGMYHGLWKGEPAWIELFVDNILQYTPKIALYIPFLKSFAFADTLYHEIGHHIHKVKHKVFEEPEDVADKWKNWLRRRFFTRRYWYLLPFLLIIFCIIRPKQAFTILKKKSRRNS